MTHRTLKNLLSLTILASFAGLTACEGEENLDAGEAEFLFDMELEDVLALHAAHSPETSEEEFIEAFSAPFKCEGFGHICEEMGKEGAIEFMRQTTELGLSGATQDEMNEFADQLSREIVANAPVPDEEGESEAEQEFRAFGATYTHYQYFDGIRTRLKYGRTNPLTSDAYGWGKLIQQKQGVFGSWSQINEPYKLYLQLKSVHHYESSLWGPVTHSDSAVRSSSKYEGTYNLAGTDGLIYFKHTYDRPAAGWGWTIDGPAEIHNWIYTKACSRGWSNSTTSSTLQCWTDSASHF